MNKNLHKRNLKGHVKIHEREAEQMMCNGRGLGLILGRSINNQCHDVQRAIEDVRGAVTVPHLMNRELDILQYHLAQLSKDLAEAMKDVGELLELSYSLRGGNETLLKLINERKELERQVEEKPRKRKPKPISDKAEEVDYGMPFPYMVGSLEK